MNISLRLPHRHNFKVRPGTVTEYGAEFLCHKCLKTDYMAWTTPMERINAQVYLTVKHSAVLAAVKER